MKAKDFFKELILEITAFFVAIIFIILTGFKYSLWMALAETILLILFTSLQVAKFFTSREKEIKVEKMLYEELDVSDENSIKAFPLPILVSSTDGVISMINTKFYHTFVNDENMQTKNAGEFLGGCTPQEIADSDGTIVKINDNYYTVYASILDSKGQKSYAFYYIDVTDMRRTQLEYIKSRPIIMLMQTDDIADLKGGYRDSERAEIRSGIEAAIENWAADYSCIMRKISEDRFMVIADSDGLDSMRRDKFSVLDDVRNYKYKDRVLGITLAIGAGAGKTIRDCEAAAERSLEMALGRGGDQAAVKTKDDYEFFGGVSKSIETMNKFQARVAASSLLSLITASNNVIIMGHFYPDMDAFGAAVGINAIARSKGIDCAIALDRERNFVNPVVDMLEKDGWDGTILNEEQALEAINRKTLLVIVDTHRSSLVNFKSVYKKANAVVVIDHHRKAVDYIDNALIFYHDPNSSSTCEIVSELLRYISPEPYLSVTEAQAMLSGIMLDTKEFILNTGVRTFEAAAFLKAKGADTVKVKRLFATSMEINQERNKIIASAKLYNGCAISCAGDDVKNARLVSSQAADELLEIENVKASFVLFETEDGGINISARSYGDRNVQIIMEYLGGGGHRTMAAVQLKNIKMENAAARLKEAIDAKYPHA